MVRGITWSNELETVLGQDAAATTGNNGGDDHDNDDNAGNKNDNMQGGQDSVSMHMSDASFFADLGRNNNNDNENNAGGGGMLGSFLK